jgi:voltage-gated potassium channel Kch
MPTVNRHNNFIYFTLSLILLVFSSALTDSIPKGFANVFFQAVGLATLIVAYLSLNFGPRWRRLVIAFSVALVVTNALAQGQVWHYAELASLVLLLAFFVCTVYVAGRQVLLSGDVELNTVVGSLAIYLLLGLIWAVLYLIMLEFSPAAFNGVEYREWGENFPQVLYFSYVTLTTLGYGDISPAQPVSQVLVYLEAISGTFYMAIVVASLIGARTPTIFNNNPSNDS